MANPITTAFAFQKSPDGRRAVHCDGAVIQVQTEPEAKLLANLPVEHAKLSTGSGPDRAHVQKILAVCKDYDLYKMFAVRQLDHWLRKSGPQAVAA